MSDTASPLSETRGVREVRAACDRDGVAEAGIRTLPKPATYTVLVAGKMPNTRDMNVSFGHLIWNLPSK